MRDMGVGNGEDKPNEQQFVDSKLHATRFKNRFTHWRFVDANANTHTSHMTECESLTLCCTNQWVFVFCSFIHSLLKCVLRSESSCKTFDMDEMKRSFVG